MIRGPGTGDLEVEFNNPVMPSTIQSGDTLDSPINFRDSISSGILNPQSDSSIMPFSHRPSRRVNAAQPVFGNHPRPEHLLFIANLFRSSLPSQDQEPETLMHQNSPSRGLAHWTSAFSAGTTAGPWIRQNQSHTRQIPR